MPYNQPKITLPQNGKKLQKNKAMHPDHSLLKDPFYNALHTTQKPLAMGTERIKKFPADVLPFVGLKEYDGNILHEIEPFMQANEEVFIKDLFTNIPANWAVLNHVPVMQMVCTKPSEITITQDIQLLCENDYGELFSVVDLVQPGYFKPNTHLLGKYYGIRKNGALVAVAGERLKITGFIEVSAVCTMPGHTGKGYAQQLMALLINQIFNAGNIPFLHVLATNTRAITLYKYLHFYKSMNFPLIKAKMVGYG